MQGEGAAYRGRILVELSTKLDGKADTSVEEIPSDDILVVQVWLFVEFAYRVVFLLKPLFTALCSFLCIEIPAQKEVLSVCSVSQCHYDPRTRGAHSV